MISRKSFRSETEHKKGWDSGAGVARKCGGNMKEIWAGLSLITLYKMICTETVSFGLFTFSAFHLPNLVGWSKRNVFLKLILLLSKKKKKDRETSTIICFVMLVDMRVWWMEAHMVQK